MAYDLYPYSGRTSGAVSDSEHELLWTPHLDGILPGQASTALQPSVDASRSWTVQGGKALVSGHVLSSDGAVTGTLAANGGTADRIDLIVFRIDRTVSPWNKNITVRQGTPGAGTPSPARDVNGVYEFVLGVATVQPSGAAHLNYDARVGHSGGIMYCTSNFHPQGPMLGAVAYETDTGNHVFWDGTAWQTLRQDTTTNLSPRGSWSVSSQPTLTLVNGWVQLEGSLTRTTDTLHTSDDQSPVLAGIPAGFRPRKDLHNQATITNGSAMILVFANGSTCQLTQTTADIPIGNHVFFNTSWPVA